MNLQKFNPIAGITKGIADKLNNTGNVVALASIALAILLVCLVMAVFIKFSLNPADIRTLLVLYLGSLTANFYYWKQL